MYIGIDYGNGRTNIDANGIRYGIMPLHAVSNWIYDELEAVQNGPSCPACGLEVKELTPDQHEKLPNIEMYHHFYCVTCENAWREEDCYYDSLQWQYNKDGYKCEKNEDNNELWILKSSYFTYAQFCSPCAPGACYLTQPVSADNADNKVYCLGSEFFDEENPCPYVMYSVETGEKVTQ